MLEEYGAEYRHIASKDNVVADALSRMDTNFHGEGVADELLEQNNNDADENNHEHINIKDTDKCMYLCAHVMSNMTCNEAYLDDEDEDGDEILNNISEHIFAQSPNAITEHYPLLPALFAREEQKDTELQQNVKESEDYGTITVEDIELISLNGKVVVPHSLQGQIVSWYHDYLIHPGSKCLEKTIGQILWWKELGDDTKKYVKTCHKCQLYKKSNKKKYAKMPCKKAEESKPWRHVYLDCVGPWSVHTPDGKTHKLRALTMIDPATGWFKLAELLEINSQCIADAYDDIWLSRYPRPNDIVYDGGGEFKKVFEQVCRITTADKPGMAFDHIS